MSRDSKVKGLADLNRDSESDEEVKRQEFYTGGEKSGTAVQGPPSSAGGGAGGNRNTGEGDDSHHSIVRDILGKAARNSDVKSAEKKKPLVFSGTGYRLGSESDPQQPASSGSASSQLPLDSTQQQELEPVSRRLVFWKDGFTIEDGPLMRYDDPRNEMALNAINSGRAPLELLNVQVGQEVEVKVDHRLHEAWSAASAKALADAAARMLGGVKKQPQAFTGTGHRLGGASEASSSSSSSAIPGAFPSSSAVAAHAAPPALDVDLSLPTTSVQIRLADGTRLVTKMNHTHTVGDIRQFINASRPGSSSVPFALMTTFPNRELTDDTVSLKEAGLINAVVVQKLL